jgi:SOS response regulatory protein OraA/RecX
MVFKAKKDRPTGTAKGKLTRILAMRDISVAEARQKLTLAGFSSEDTEAAVAWGLEFNFLDERRMAGNLVENGRRKLPPLGKEHLRRCLERRRIPIEICREVLDAAFEGVDRAGELLEYVRRVRGRVKPTTLFGRLIRKGHSPAAIRTAFRTGGVGVDEEFSNQDL